MTSIALSAGTSSAALDALHHAITNAEVVALPEDGRVLFLRARDGHWWGDLSRARWVCQQSFRPFAEVLERSGLEVREPASGEEFAAVLILPPRQRDEARALFAQAVRHARPHGVVVVSMANAEGAKSGEADFRRLVGNTQVLSKHHCRVFWSRDLDEGVDQQLLDEWQTLDDMKAIAQGQYLSRPGLFAWNRIDPASSLLAAHLADSIGGRVADLGAGYGYLASEVVRKCSGVRAIDLYEAEARALEPARINLQHAVAESGREIVVDVLWHDVRRGLPKRYDAIISNPPFHQGRADQPELGQAFIDAAARALDPDGRFWMVANRHLPYEATLTTRFSKVQVLAMKDGFKVFEASGVRA